MTKASPFDATFSKLSGYGPFRWQRRLFEQWLALGRAPSACDIPTGLGKTSVMALWLIARHWGAALPRRLVYVVDRRAVVDQATAFADSLKQNAKGALGIDDLAISTLRGQHVDNRRWLENPAAPAIVVGTIDMIGSRLLFSGYGVSRRMRPYHAGFLGADTLVLLDEAHLCPPFENLLRSVASQDCLKPADEESRSLIPPFRLLPLSATRSDVHDDTFRLEEADTDPETQPIAHRRLHARKRLHVKQLPAGAKAQDISKELAERAWELASQDAPTRVLVYTNSRKLAVQLKDTIDRGAKKEKRACSTQLLVGARRVHERQKLHSWLEAHGFLGDAEPPSESVVLFATAAGEVGVDLDADHIVCDLVEWERMVQRFGRVNRRGGSERRARIEVIAVPPKQGGKNAEEEKAAFDAQMAALHSLSVGDDGYRDASPAAIDALRDRSQVEPDLAEILRRARSQPPMRPALTRPLVEAWSLTTLEQHPGRPDVEPWLRGWTGDEPQTSVAWRRYLPWPEGRAPTVEEANRFFAVARVHLEETLEAPTHQIFEALTKRAKALMRDGDENRDVRALMILDAAGRYEDSLRLDKLAQLADLSGRDKDAAIGRWIGRTLVAQQALGGLDGDGMLEPDPKLGKPPDVVDGGWDDGDRLRVGFNVVGPDSPEPDGSTWRLAESLALSHPDESEDETGQLLRVFVTRGKGPAREGDPAVAATAQALDDHHRWAAEDAAALASELELPQAYRDMLVAAAGHHDAGKARPLWQQAMKAPLEGRPYAKTKGGGDGRRLNGYRHEFGSLADIEASPAISALDESLRDLAVHLIAAHHGYARPTIPPFDPGAPPSERAARAEETTLRYARLLRRWGPWGLAWWEAVLRAADHRASARLDAKGGE